MAAKSAVKKIQRSATLRTLMNVGGAVEGYLNDLGIHSVAELATQDADALYRRLQRRIGKACDPCLHDTFSAVIHEARTGEKTPWFAWTAKRKRREAAGELDLALSNKKQRR